MSNHERRKGSQCQEDLYIYAVDELNMHVHICTYSENPVLFFTEQYAYLTSPNCDLKLNDEKCDEKSYPHRDWLVLILSRLSHKHYHRTVKSYMQTINTGFLIVYIHTCVSS